MSKEKNMKVGSRGNSCFSDYASFISKRFVLILFAAFVLQFGLCAQDWLENVKSWFLNKQDFQEEGLGIQYIIPSNHWVYDAVYFLMLESGTLPVSYDTPMSAGELEMYFQDIIVSNLHKDRMELYYKVENWFNALKKTKGNLPFNFSFQPSLNPALFYRNVNDKISYPEFDYTDITPVVNIPISLQISSYAYLHCDLSIMQKLKFAHSPKRYTNIPYKAGAEEEMDPTYSRFSHMSIGVPIKGKNFVNFKIGRGGLNIAKTATPSIILSESMNSATYAQLSFFAPSIKYSATVLQLAVNKYMYFHTLNLRFFKRVTIGVSGGLMVNAPLELTYLNPIEHFHGLAPWTRYDHYNKDLANGTYKSGDSRIGSFFAARFEVNPWKYMRLYALFQMNEFQLSSETQDVPNSLGIQAGFDMSLPYKGGYWTPNLEFLWTSPYMYKVRSKNWSFCMERRGFYGSAQHQWTGTPFGPDSIMGQLSLGYTRPSRWTVKGFYRFLAQGEMNDEIAATEPDGMWKKWPNSVAQAKIKTPSGTPKYTHRFGIEGKYILNRYFSFDAYTGLSYIVNNAHKSGKGIFSFEGAFVCKVSLFGGWKSLLSSN